MRWVPRRPSPSFRFRIALCQPAPSRERAVCPCALLEDELHLILPVVTRSERFRIAIDRCASAEQPGASQPASPPATMAMSGHWLNHMNAPSQSTPTLLPGAIIHRKSFPPHEYHTRGAPRTAVPKITTYGYTIKNVQIMDRDPYGKRCQKTIALPRPKDPSLTRTKSSACTIRPDRSLTVKQILAGEYFARPDLAKYEQLVHQQRMAAFQPDDFDAKFSAKPDARTGAGVRVLAPSQSAPALSTMKTLSFASAPASALPPVASEAKLPTRDAAAVA